jgi:hypothetical protein
MTVPDASVSSTGAVASEYQVPRALPDIVNGEAIFSPGSGASTVIRSGSDAAVTELEDPEAVVDVALVPEFCGIVGAFDSPGTKKMMANTISMAASTARRILCVFMFLVYS